MANLRSAVLTANELGSLTDWPQILIEDYLNLARNISIIEADSDVSALEARVTILEFDVNSLEDRTDTLEISVTAVEIRTTDLESDVTALEGRVSLLESGLIAVEDRTTTLENLIVELVPSGYGGGRQFAAVPSYTIPTVTYVTLPFDTLSPSVERGVTFDLPSNTFTFTVKGVWLLTVNLNVQGHNSSNSGRNFAVRLFNATDSIAGGGAVVGVGRNQQDTFVSFSLQIEVSQADVDDVDAYRIEVGNADTAITGGTLIGASVQVSHVSELGALI